MSIFKKQMKRKFRLESDVYVDFAKWIKENYPNCNVFQNIEFLAARSPYAKELPKVYWHVDDIAQIMIYIESINSSKIPQKK